MYTKNGESLKYIFKIYICFDLTVKDKQFTTRKKPIDLVLKVDQTP